MKTGELCYSVLSVLGRTDRIKERIKEMPAYFSMIFTCKKNMVFEGLIQDFCDSLMNAGFVFQSGYWGYEEDSLSEIAAWNQQKLREDHEPDPKAAYLTGYKQIMFTYGGFSEVRMFVQNYKEDDTFSFHVVLPEDELILWMKGRPDYDRKKVKGLLAVCERIWQRPYVERIQTELELSDPLSEEEEIRKGAEPGAEPFAILAGELWKMWKENSLYVEKYVCRRIQRDGVIISRRGAQDKELAMNQELQDRIIALIEEILMVPSGTITADTRIEEVEEWDSLMHVTIIGELEEQLGVKIPLEDAIELKSMPELLEKAGCL